jgi:hypothetical protein
VNYAMKYGITQRRPLPTSFTPCKLELWFIQHGTLYLITLQVSCPNLMIPAIESNLLSKVSLHLTFKFISNVIWAIKMQVKFQCHKIITNIMGSSCASDGLLTVTTKTARHEYVRHSLRTDGHS